MGGMAEPAAFLLDPLNITGAQDAIANSQGGPSRGYPTQSPFYALPLPDPAAWQPKPAGGAAPPVEPGGFKGFIESLGGLDDWSGKPFWRGDLKTAAPPPPPQWIYEQGKGATWGTPERVGATNDFTFKGNATGSAGFNAHKGNRF